ncbi:MULTISPECIES: hypothetical protein [Methylobacteriaceae]|uniref:hypothetical protein n=1 Tax=Methylorubrum extorquens TaxID=408 RepID=UPI0009B66647
MQAALKLAQAGDAIIVWMLDRIARSLRCSVPLCGVTTDAAWRDALWDRFSTAAPRRLRRSVGQSKLVKRA